MNRLYKSFAPDTVACSRDATIFRATNQQRSNDVDVSTLHLFKYSSSYFCYYLPFYKQLRKVTLEKGAEIKSVNFFNIYELYVFSLAAQLVILSLLPLLLKLASFSVFYTVLL